MSGIDFLLHGFAIVLLDPANLLFCSIGVFMGTLVGVLPGVGPSAGAALLLPITYRLPGIQGILMLSGILYGAMYGGSTTSILLNIPGEAASVITCIDGYQMARKGRAGPALGIAAIGSFIAGTVTVILLSMTAPIMAGMALKMGAPEYFSLMTLGLLVLTFLARGSMVKALIMTVMGLWLSQLGMDPNTGQHRFTFGIVRLWDGVPMVPLFMGVFGISEILENLEKEIPVEVVKTKIKDLFPNLEEWKRSVGPIIRGTFSGFPLGLVPGAANTVASIISYAMEKKLSKTPEKFGTGMIEGVAGPESANNAAATGQFIPLLILGIPTSTFTAIIYAGLLIHGVQAGPFLISQHPDIFWGVISSMYIGNVLLLILNFPMIGIWVQMLRVPFKVMFPLIILFCLIGSYSINNSNFDVFIMIFFGIIGYLCRKFGFDTIPFVMAFVLGGIMENSFRQSLAIGHGTFLIFLYRPISAVCLGLGLILLAHSVISSKMGKGRPHLLDED